MRKKQPAVMITAGTKRVGFHLAQACIKMGYSVILHYRSTDTFARSWLKKKPAFQDRFFFIQHELNDSPEAIIEKAKDLPCMLTGLINNASIFTPGNLFDFRHLQQMLNIHLVVPARLGSHFAKYVNDGWIINISDAMIRRPNATYQNYRMSKLFLDELTRQQAFLYAPGIRVNAIAPGILLPAENNDGHTTDEYIKSERSWKPGNSLQSAGGNNSSSLANPGNRPEDTIHWQIQKRIHPQTTGSIDSFLEAFQFLVKNSYCTGQIITVDGGWNLNS